MTIKTIRMDKENFADYGTYIVKPSRAESNEVYTYTRDMVYQELKVTSVGYLSVYPHKPCYSSLERHMNTSEMLVVLKGQGTILFGKPGEDPNDGLIALNVEEGDAFIMHPSTWHGLILPTGCSNIDLLVMFEKNTEDLDMNIQELSEVVFLEFT